MDFKSNIKSIQRILEIGEYTSAATECGKLIEQALQQVFSRHLEQLDEAVKRKVREEVQKRDRRGEGLKGLTMGQLVQVLRKSKFLDAWARVSGKDLSGLQVIDLDKLIKLRNKLIHKGREATRAEAEFLFRCLYVFLEIFDIVSLKDMEGIVTLPQQAEEAQVKFLPPFLLSVSLCLCGYKKYKRAFLVEIRKQNLTLSR